jgi:hypothetical protein
MAQTAIKTRKTKVAKQAKIVSVINRYQFKSDSRKVVYQVGSSDGSKTYYTYFFGDRATSCTCPASKPCYHMEQLEAYEVKRTAFLQASKAVKAEDARIAQLSGTRQGLDQLRREAQVETQEVEESHEIEKTEAEEEASIIEQAEAEEKRIEELAAIAQADQEAQKEVQDAFEKREIAYVAEQARKRREHREHREQAQKRSAAPLNGNRAFKLI